MKWIILVIGLSGCALTGDPVKDCLAATNAVNAAEAASAIASVVAAANPQSDRMQQAAMLAQVSLGIAQTQQIRACPKVGG